MSKHTPGPWLYSEESRHGCYTYKVDSYSIRAPHTNDGSIATGIRDPYTGGPSMANARLIAAAPDLLEALKRAEEMLCKQDDELTSLGADESNAESAILFARAAIAKAEGTDK